VLCVNFIGFLGVIEDFGKSFCPNSYQNGFDPQFLQFIHMLYNSVTVTRFRQIPPAVLSSAPTDDTAAA